MTVVKVGVIGCGFVGSGIIRACVQAGLDVTVIDSRPESSTTAEHAFRSWSDRSAVSADVRFSTNLRDIDDRELVIECIPEHRQRKLALLAEVSKRVEHRDCILASTTSSIQIADLAAATVHPDRFLGLHFLHPAHRIPVVEVVRSIHTSDLTVATASDFIRALGKRIIVAPDRPGFALNAVLVPFLLESIALLDNSTLSVDEIDDLFASACGWPAGPLKMCDFVGLDTIAAIAEELGGASGSSPKAPLKQQLPGALAQRLQRGHLGRKSGIGFYNYQPS